MVLSEDFKNVTVTNPSLVLVVLLQERNSDQYNSLGKSP